MLSKTASWGAVALIVLTALAIAPTVAQGTSTAQTTHPLNVRTGPGITNPIIAVLPAGATVALEGRDAAGGWVLVRSVEGDIHGWVSAQFLTFAEGVSLSDLSVTEEHVAAPPAPPPAADATTTTTAVNLREGPGEEHAIITVLPRGTEVVVESHSANGWWAQVHTANGYRGWVGARLLSIPEAPPPPQEQPAVEVLPPPAIQVSARTREIYLQGQAMGNNPYAFSVMGSCNSRIPFFLAPFDTGEYNLSPHAHLQRTINHFSGSFNRWNLTVMGAARTWSMFDTTWADPRYCQPGETPIACEYRLNRPSAVFISLSCEGVNQSYDQFASDMRAIVEFWITRGVIPILGTQAHGSGTNQTNSIITQLAAEYDVPLWDFAAAVQGLPDRGLRPDGFHLSWHSLDYTNPQTMLSGWGVRNLTALQILDAVWRGAMQ